MRQGRSWIAVAIAAASLACSEPPGFVSVGSLRPGYGVVSDLAVLEDRLVAAVNADPLSQPGAALVASEDGRRFERLLDRDDSEGILRLRLGNGELIAPDADPPGQGAGRVWLLDAAGGIHEQTIPEVAHSYDAWFSQGSWFVSGGATDFTGSLHRALPEGGWQRAAEVPALRIQYLAAFGDRLFASKTLSKRREDYYTWRVGEAPEPVDAVGGEAQTWCWLVTSTGRLSWSYWTKGKGGRVRYTEDGERWRPVSTLDGLFVWDLVEHDGVLYALSHEGLWAAADGFRFEVLPLEPPGDAFMPVMTARGTANVEAQGSLVSWRGTLWAGSLRNAELYRVVLPPDEG